ncbi:MAG TPA: class I SAM-dependent methyltransferase [Flavobacterium sp.]|jgi:SAM-dependent methyltransferase|uniref:class I SAM-dependent methyltransferase n=1 Tax=Flavobacterium sp. TaxID=239 RepID=UPI001B64798D|nr:class I SAM-dependent methyltransferase [Flavobacterium sp.]MBP6146203.1 class I SAM-dependent methyltransferase [Flavobacterium sp.]MBP7181866.1 class I SAM-dependent methyltransferase [Flavobacterium sp.]MBP7317618.1 class I SAM-dependent methyltransferase [Flavobacterium sp.]MBP8885861.1 class I SAM-dependent methyltransferase [Flavobacterium sp.]HRL70964.1 class I SAM-dependent methyltransferase [Flavobacterium sp.]
MSEAKKLSTENQVKPTEKWYSSWFDTPYYHILYKERNYREAQVFMDNLTHYLNLPEKATVLDLACGKGRHSIYLNQLGFTVLGADLSENSIAEANKNANETLHFKVHDMREPFEEKFDAIFNLFTSFGYFENDDDNLTTLKAIKESLSDYGFAVIDFMNVSQVIETLVPEEIKTMEGIDFHIKRYLKENHIYKEIDFEDQGQKFHFTEKVKALTLKDFEDLMEEAGIYLLDIFGDYKLKKFHKTESERLIMIFK